MIALSRLDRSEERVDRCWRSKRAPKAPRVFELPASGAGHVHKVGRCGGEGRRKVEIKCRRYIHLMPTQGEKWQRTGGFGERPPRFSWWAVFTLVVLLLIVAVMLVVRSC